MLFAPIWCLPQLPSQLRSALCSTYPRTWWNGLLFRDISKKGPLPMSVKTVPRLQLEGISRTFSLADGRQRAVLDDISLTVHPGEFGSMSGSSGCGKSTLFNIIAGLDSPTSGTVGIDGEVAYMPQKDALFPWRSIAANAALGLEVQGVKRRAARARVKEWFPRFGLAGFEDSLPFELSGGMRQRAAL